VEEAVAARQEAPGEALEADWEHIVAVSFAITFSVFS
jgi:hypothetical protein